VADRAPASLVALASLGPFTFELLTLKDLLLSAALMLAVSRVHTDFAQLVLVHP
jgi:hypothetical protein